MTVIDSRTRIDSHPTHRIAGYEVRTGRPYPFGVTSVPGGLTFSVYSDRARSMTLVLFERGKDEPLAELEFPADFRVGSVFSMTVFGLDPETLEYGFRADGPFDPVRGDRFDASQILVDPHARLISGREVWGSPPNRDRIYPYRSRPLLEDFHWGDDRPPGIPMEELVIYETHVRGFTRHPSSGVSAPGTYAGLREKIPYLRELGVNCVELMPIFEFDEFDNPHTDSEGNPLRNYWGYNTLGFFAPKAGYAATGKYGMQADEFKALVKELHRAGIEVILDVVFNHTAEGNENGPTISFRGLDNTTYYMLTPEGYYYNFSGTGNTMNCNHPVVRGFILDCLRYWVAEYHIDGFRFDLAAILDRAGDGTPLPNPPLLEQLAYDPLLRNCKLIAEAWDAAGLYEVGSFPSYGRWSEWNGKYRDTVRRFLKGDSGVVGELATRVIGSPDLYDGRGAIASINFVTAHDGFTLNDLVSYNDKHNEANGEGNADGANDNNSWNCGVEGPTTDPGVNALRLRQMKNAMAVLLTSQGVPMILSGDEVGRTQLGNNNTYCQDNELSWFDWTLGESNPELFRFVRHLIAFRHAHPALRPAWHPYDAVTWHGVRAGEPDWSAESRFLAVTRHGPDGDVVHVAMNAHWEAHDTQLPQPPPGLEWCLAADTAAPAPHDVHPAGTEPPLTHPGRYLVAPRSTVILVGRAPSDQPPEKESPWLSPLPSP
ncbi:glycogen operon protein GlgX homolog [Planobispora rosea]|uniref:Glycogen operon protein GlgX homolog n=1 Tax=Planobispora rosea TaxID=35762 RepID=A0A8J3S3U3_PLARO|nr:glycogen debranching protein GlgX [Planobispora rosea]GGS93420.1 glycogen operon protein GlgX homolog [Planobispora rosea]GIH87262.1 glycogen operon protein GlgX homolog [Planobispora rosea]